MEAAGGRDAQGWGGGAPPPPTRAQPPMRRRCWRGDPPPCSAPPSTRQLHPVPPSPPQPESRNSWPKHQIQPEAMLGLTRWLLFVGFFFLIRINSHDLKMGAFLIKIHISTQFGKEKAGADASQSCSDSWQRSGQTTLACSCPQFPPGPPAGPLAPHSC